MNGTGGRGNRRTRKDKRQEELMIRNDVKNEKEDQQKESQKVEAGEKRKGREEGEGREKKYIYKQSLKITQLCPTLCDLMDYAQSMEFSRPENWSG